MRYFFSKWDDFAAALRKKKGLLLFFDFDGTLAPIVSSPARARISAAVKARLKKISKNRRVVMGVISGRSLKDIRRLVGVKGIYYAGNHGLEMKGPKTAFIHPSVKKYGPYMKKIAASLRRAVSGIKGVVMEDKNLSLSLHYRMVRPRDVARLKSIFGSVCAPYIKSGKVRLTTGKKVLEIRPPVLWDKGKAVRAIAKAAAKKNALKVFIGDDLTDEDAFKVLKKGDFPIRVAKSGRSKAKYFLKGPGEVSRFLIKLNKILAAVFIVISVALMPFSPAAIADGDSSQEAQTAPAPEKPIKVKTRVYTTVTEDGWRISMNRYIAKEIGAEKRKAAVVLCHGFNINNTFWDLNRRSSLARFLARAGYDVWAPSLRGSGLSSKPVLSKIRGLVKLDLKNLPFTLIKAPFDMTKFGWTLDDHIHKDVPAIIEFVKKESGFEKLYWVGHSMGGIVMFGYLETESRDDIAGFIALASMMVVPRELNAQLNTIANQKPILNASLLINSTVASQLRNFTFGAVSHPIENLLFNEENMRQKTLYRFFRICIDDTSSGVVTQFSDSIRLGSIFSADRRYNYTNHIWKVDTPILIAGGKADRFVGERELGLCYEMLSSADKDIIIFSEENGYCADYGHCDLILGKNSESEIYPAILAWLDERVSR